MVATCGPVYETRFICDDHGVRMIVIRNGVEELNIEVPAKMAGKVSLQVGYIAGLVSKALDEQKAAQHDRP